MADGLSVFFQSYFIVLIHKPGCFSKKNQKSPRPCRTPALPSLRKKEKIAGRLFRAGD